VRIVNNNDNLATKDELLLEEGQLEEGPSWSTLVACLLSWLLLLLAPPSWLPASLAR
jgi:hypothetical protein